LQVLAVRGTERTPDRKAPTQPSRLTARNAAAPAGSGMSVHLATLPFTFTVAVGVSCQSHIAAAAMTSARTEMAPAVRTRIRFLRPRACTSPGWTAAAAKGDLIELNGWSSPQMLRLYGASASARRAYDRIMESRP